MPAHLDVVVIGGGAAGLSAALYLGRSRRRVLLADDDRPRNAASASVHGFLSRDGASPGELLTAARAEVDRYGVEHAGAVRTVRRDDDVLTVVLEDGREVSTRRVLVATGLSDTLPDFPGLADRWGRDILHCPYCHGYEVRDRALAVLAGDPEGAVHQGLLLRQWSADVTVLLDRLAPEDLDEHGRALLEARGVRLVTGRVQELVVRDDALTGVVVDGAGEVPAAALFVPLRLTVNDAPVADLGLERETSDMGECLATDDEGRTSVPGVWAAGNVADLAAQVIGAAEAGARAAIGINGELALEDAEAALAATTTAEVAP